MAGKNYHLAQFNYAQACAPLDDPRMYGFVSNLRYINGLADQAPGFVWRLQTESGDATDIRAFDDPLKFITLSVWESIEALLDFTYHHKHGAIMRHRKQWFEHIKETYIVLWWIPAGHIPTVEESKARLEHLRRYGPTHYAFDFKTRFPMPQDKEEALRYTMIHTATSQLA
jgi:heme-degrading monooxygenase HmoA